MASPLLTVDEIKAWMDVPAACAALAEKLAAQAWDVRQAVGGVYTSLPLGAYVHMDTEHIGIYAPAGTPDHDVLLVKTAARRVGVCRGIPLTQSQLDTGAWVKVAYTPVLLTKSAAGSKLLRVPGEALGFFPGDVTGLPNYAQPAVSTLASGLVGAGLGYGAGWLGEKLMPDRWRRGRLRKTLTAVGGLGGAALGALPGFANMMSGRNFNDTSALNVKFNEEPTYAVPPAKEVVGFDKLSPQWLDNCKTAAANFAAWQRAEFKAAAEDENAEMDNFGPMSGPPINVNAIGEVLWQSAASPQTTGMTLGALAAAQQMPGGVGRPGFVTPQQMGELAMHMGAGYVSGALVGGVLGALTGMPDETQETLRRTGMYTGLIRAVIPKLFGG